MEFIRSMLADAYRAVGRLRALTERSWANCLGFGVYAPDGDQVGHALVETIVARPDLVTMSHWTLGTADAHDLYARYGFRTSAGDGQWMTLIRNVLGQPSQ